MGATTGSRSKPVVSATGLLGQVQTEQAVETEAAQIYDESHRLFEDMGKKLPAEPSVLLASALHLARLGNAEEAVSREKKALTLACTPQ